MKTYIKVIKVIFLLSLPIIIIAFVINVDWLFKCSIAIASTMLPFWALFAYAQKKDNQDDATIEKWRRDYLAKHTSSKPE